MRTIRVRHFGILALLTTACAVASIPFQVSAAQVSKDVVVSGKAMPWSISQNTLYQYGVNDGAAPTVVDESDGISFAAGGTITVEYVSGTTGYGPAAGFDALGVTTYVANDFKGSSREFFPSNYMTPYPIFLNALVGTFADGAGSIVGTPFAINLGPAALSVPAGAARLQLGINDDMFGDNTGALTVSVTGSAVPAPAALWLFGTALLGLAGAVRRRNRQA